MTDNSQTHVDGELLMCERLPKQLESHIRLKSSCTEGGPNGGQQMLVWRPGRKMIVHVATERLGKQAAAL